jgi:hypothetical protein
MFHSIIGVAGVLGLIALAFGESAAMRTAQALIFTVLSLGSLVMLDIMTRGALSTFIVGY